MAERKPVLVSEEEMTEQRLMMERVRHAPDRPKTFHIITYGCQMNAHDSEFLAGMLLEMGLTEAESKETADLVIFNTCSVRDNAERRALGNVSWLKTLRKDHPVMIGVCGCMIQQQGMAEKILKQYKFVDFAFGTSNLHRFPSILFEALHSDATVLTVDHQDLIPEELPVMRLRHDAAYLTIMYGCDNFCTFCIVPHVRGRERSRSVDAILREAESLQQSGVKEIMLLGQNVNSYGKGLEDGCNFAELLRKLDGVGIERIRFMTSHPKDLSDELIRVIADSKHVLPQFHLPVQSGNDEILRRMNRHYTRAQYMDRLNSLRQAVPGIGLTTDIIVGFPGETEAQFRDTLDLVEEVGYDSAFTFVYSPRPGTGAARLPDQIPADISKDRIERLIALQEARQKTTLARFIGQEERVLVESISRRSAAAVSGKGRYGVSITLPGGESDIGQIVNVKITEMKNNTLLGQRL